MKPGNHFIESSSEVSSEYEDKTYSYECVQNFPEEEYFMSAADPSFNQID